MLQTFKPNPTVAATLYVVDDDNEEDEGGANPLPPPDDDDDDDDDIETSHLSSSEEGRVEAGWIREARVEALFATYAPAADRAAAVASGSAAGLLLVNNAWIGSIAQRGRFAPISWSGKLHHIKRSAWLSSLHVILVDFNGNVHELKDGNNHPTRALSGKNIREVACGARHIIAISAHDAIWAWGQNERGQCGLGEGVERVDTPTEILSLNGCEVLGIACGSTHTLAFSSEVLWSWGANGHGQLGLGKEKSTIDHYVPHSVRTMLGAGITDVAAGRNHSIALLGCDEVWGWGSSLQGQLFGLGEAGGSTTTPRRIEWFTGRSIVQISAGEQHSAALDMDGTVYSWGRFGNDGALRTVATPLIVGDPADHIVKLAACATGVYAATRAGKVLVVGESLGEQVISHWASSSPPSAFHAAFVNVASGPSACGCVVFSSDLPKEQPCPSWAPAHYSSSAVLVRTRSEIAKDLWTSGFLVDNEEAAKARRLLDPSDATVSLSTEAAVLTDGLFDLVLRADGVSDDGEGDDFPEQHLLLEDGRSMAVHRALLSVRLPGLEAEIAAEAVDGPRGVQICVLRGVSRRSLTALVSFAYFGSVAALTKLRTSSLINLAACSARFRVPRILWLVQEELQHRLHRPLESGANAASAAAKMAMQILLGSMQFDLLVLQKIVLGYLQANHENLVASHADVWVEHLSSDPLQAGILSTILQLGHDRLAAQILGRLPDLGSCPPDGLDVSMRALFRRVRVGTIDSEDPYDGGTNDNGGAPDCMIRTSSGLVFYVHAAVLRARSAFFQKALKYEALKERSVHQQYAFSLFLSEDQFVNPAPPSDAAFMSLLRFLYTGNLRRVIPQQTALYLLRTVDFFCLFSKHDERRLLLACRAALSCKVTCETALPLLRAAHRLNESEIRDSAMRFCVDKSEAVLLENPLVPASSPLSDESLESFCAEVPELAAALIRAIIVQVKRTKAAEGNSDGDSDGDTLEQTEDGGDGQRAEMETASESDCEGPSPTLNPGGGGGSVGSGGDGGLVGDDAAVSAPQQSGMLPLLPP